MAETESQSRRKLIIKLIKRGPPSDDASDDACCNKRIKVVGSWVDKDSEVPKIQTPVKQNTRVQESKKTQGFKKHGAISSMRKVANDDQVSAFIPTKYGVVKEKQRGGSRISRSGSEECKVVNLKKKKKKKMKKEGVEWEKEKKKPMDHYKKMKCWVILKRLMIGRDAWPFKHSLFLKDLDILHNSVHEYSMSKPTIMGVKNNIKSELESSETIVKPIGLEDIESKLNKWLYFEPDEFADDIRLVFSYAMLHPPRNQIHKIARRLSEDFELKWKSLKEEWSKEDRKGKKIYKRKV